MVEIAEADRSISPQSKWWQCQ